MNIACAVCLSAATLWSVPGGAMAKTVTDDNADSTLVALSVSPAEVAEDADATTVTVTAELTGGAFPGPTTVSVSVGAAADVATEGTDYATVADFVLTIPAGTTTGMATFTLTPTNDVWAEGDETLSVSGNATRLTVSGATVTITDDRDLALTGIARSVAAYGRTVAVGAVTGRFDRMPTALFATLRGQTLELSEARWKALGDLAGLLAGREAVDAALALVGGRRDMLSGEIAPQALVGRAATLAMERALRDESSADVGHDGGARGPTRALWGRLGAFGNAVASSGLGSAGDGFGVARAGLAGLAGLGAPGWLSGALDRTVGALRSGSFGKEFLDAGLLGGAERLRRGGSFNLQLAGADGPGGASWSLWGRYGLGRHSSPAAGSDGFSADSDMSDATAGVGLRVGSLTMGVALSRAAGEMGIDNRLLEPDLVDASRTTVLPFVRWSPLAGRDLPAMGGYSWSEAGLRDRGPSASDGTRVAALGGRTDLDRRLGAASLGLRADAFAALLGREATAELGRVSAAVTQARLALTLGTVFGSAVRFEPQLDIGARIGGDEETGSGMKVGGSVKLRDANGSVRLDGTGRWLVADQAEGFEEWGASVTLAIGGSRQGSQGFGLTFEPEWGGGIRRLDDLWASRDGVGLGGVRGRGRAFVASGTGSADMASTWRPDRMRLDLDYGLSLANGAGSLAPFAGVRIEGGAHEMRVGAKVRIAGPAAPQREDASATGRGGLELALLGGRVLREGSEAGYSAGLDLRGILPRAGALVLAPFAEIRIEGDRGTIARLGAQLTLRRRTRSRNRSCRACCPCASSGRKST